MRHAVHRRPSVTTCPATTSTMRVARRLGAVEFVARDEDRRSGSGRLAQRGVEFVASTLVEPGVRLVEQPQFGATGHETGERRAPLLAGGQLARPDVDASRSATPIRCIAASISAAVAPDRRSPEPDVLAHRQVSVQPVLMTEQTDVAVGRLRGRSRGRDPARPRSLERPGGARHTAGAGSSCPPRWGRGAARSRRRRLAASPPTRAGKWPRIATTSSSSIDGRHRRRCRVDLDLGPAGTSSPCSPRTFDTAPRYGADHRSSREHTPERARSWEGRHVRSPRRCPRSRPNDRRPVGRRHLRPSDRSAGRDDRTGARRAPATVRKWDREPSPHDWRFYVGGLGRDPDRRRPADVRLRRLPAVRHRHRDRRAQSRLENEFDRQLALVEPTSPDGVDAPIESIPAETPIDRSTATSGRRLPAVSTPAGTVPVEVGTDAAAAPPAVPVADQNIPAASRTATRSPDRDPADRRRRHRRRRRRDERPQEGPGPLPRHPDCPVNSATQRSPATARPTANRSATSTSLQHRRRDQDHDPRRRVRLHGHRSTIVSPSDYQVVATTDPTIANLTLTSCHPVFTARERIVITSELDRIESDPGRRARRSTTADLDAEEPAVRPESTRHRSRRPRRATHGLDRAAARSIRRRHRARHDHGTADRCQPRCGDRRRLLRRLVQRSGRQRSGRRCGAWCSHSWRSPSTCSAAGSDVTCGLASSASSRSSSRCTSSSRTSTGCSRPTSDRVQPVVLVNKLRRRAAVCSRDGVRDRVR